MRGVVRVSLCSTDAERGHSGLLQVLSSSLQKLFYGNKDFTLPNLASIHSLGNSAERIFRYIYDVLVVYSSSFIAGFDDK